MTNSSPLKILYVVTKSNWGGAQRYVFDLAVACKAAGYTVAVAVGGEGELVKRLTQAGIETFPIGALQRDMSVERDFGTYQEFSKLFRSYKPDIVHLNSSKAGGLGALSARMNGIKRIIFTAHGWPFQERRHWLWRAIVWLASWMTALLSHAVIVVSKNDLRIGQQMPLTGGKMHLIYNGIDLTTSLGDGARIRSAFPPGVHITGTIGELTQNKNQLALIEEARKNPQMYLAIVGEGEDRTMLELAIRKYKLEERVKLFGFIPAREALRGFDTFALPSIKEGLPYVILEARAAGLPIIANRVGGVPEILDAKDMTEFSLSRMVERTFALYVP